MIVKGGVASKYKSALVIRFASKDRELDDQLLWKIIKTTHFEGITSIKSVMSSKCVVC